jgi:hypothetical protein
MPRSRANTEAGGVGAIADDGGDARVPALVGAGANDRLHVGAATRDEDDDVLHRRAQCIGAAGPIPTMSRFCRPAVDERSTPAPSDPAPSVSEGEAVTSRRRVLSGMRPTGAMHLGHWHGALKNWVHLQDSYECFYFAADWHALTTHYEEREVIESSVYDMVTDWLAAGLDPDKVTLFIQSRLPEHAELFTLLAMGRRSAGSSACRPTRTRSSGSRTATSRPTASSAIRSCRPPTS